MEIKKEALEKAINESLADIAGWPNARDEFAIHNDGCVQVQIRVTSFPEDNIDQILTDYESARLNSAAPGMRPGKDAGVFGVGWNFLLAAETRRNAKHHD